MDPNVKIHQIKRFRGIISRQGVPSGPRSSESYINKAMFDRPGTNIHYFTISIESALQTRHPHFSMTAYFGSTTWLRWHICEVICYTNIDLSSGLQLNWLQQQLYTNKHFSFILASMTVASCTYAAATVFVVTVELNWV